VIAANGRACPPVVTTPQQRFLRLIRNQPVELLPPVDSMEPSDAMGARSRESKLARRLSIGCDGEGGCRRLVNETKANELIVVTDTYEHQEGSSRPALAGIAASL